MEANEYVRRIREALESSYSPFQQKPEKMSRIEEMLASKNPEMKELGRVLKREKDTAVRLGFPLIDRMLEKYPQMIIAGSVGLFLHNIRLVRMNGGGDKDIDIILPYFVPFDNFDEVDFREPQKKTNDELNPSLDFDYTVHCSYRVEGVLQMKNFDVRIDPKRMYEVVIYEEREYKVALLEDIMLAKLRYAERGVLKHRDDLYEMVGKVKKKKEVPAANNWGGS